MPWRRNRRMIAEGFADLEYLPRGPDRWHATLAAVAYGVREGVERGGAAPTEGG